MSCLLEHVGERGLLGAAAEFAHLRAIERRFEEDDVRAEILERLDAVDGLVEAVGSAGVRAREDQDVGALVTRVDRSANAGQRLGA